MEALLQVYLCIKEKILIYYYYYYYLALIIGMKCWQSENVEAKIVLQRAEKAVPLRDEHPKIKVPGPISDNPSMYND
jgi:hypothetical protein